MCELQACFHHLLTWHHDTLPRVQFLVGRDGVPLRRYSPADPLDQGMEKDIVNALAGKPLPKRKSEQRR